MPPQRMTANPLRPARHRPGKPGVAAVETDSSDSEAEASDEAQTKPSEPHSKPGPKASSFPKSESQLSGGLKKVDINKQAVAIAEDDFETESEDGSEDGSGSESEEESEEEESSSEDEVAKRKMMRPVFMKKGARQAIQKSPGESKSEDQKWAEEEAQRKQRTDAMVQEQLEKQAQARAEGKANWDDENVPDEIDDTDGLDPEAELAAWKLRELKRVKRERDALIATEKEREEIERRRNLTAEEREAEDREHLARQKEEKDGKGKMAFMQKYFHKGAYHVEGLENRDLMGGRFQDDVQDRSALPEYMQIRDMTKLGKKGRTRYKDMKSEDTGRFGDQGVKRRPRQDDMDFRGVDERFQPDFDRDESGLGATGANASALGERKRFGDADNPSSKRLRVD